MKCPECAAVGASAVESFRIHHEDHGPVPDGFTEADLAPYQETPQRSVAVYNRHPAVAAEAAAYEAEDRVISR